jgi:hypothetical protein
VHAAGVDAARRGRRRDRRRPGRPHRVTITCAAVSLIFAFAQHSDAGSAGGTAARARAARCPGAPARSARAAPSRSGSAAATHGGGLADRRRRIPLADLAAGQRAVSARSSMRGASRRTTTPPPSPTTLRSLHGRGWRDGSRRTPRADGSTTRPRLRALGGRWSAPAASCTAVRVWWRCGHAGPSATGPHRRGTGVPRRRWPVGARRARRPPRTQPSPTSRQPRLRGAQVYALRAAADGPSAVVIAADSTDMPGYALTINRWDQQIRSHGCADWRRKRRTSWAGRSSNG